MKNYRNPPAPLWAEPVNDAALRHQPVKTTHRRYWRVDKNDPYILVSERTYGPRGERRPKKATLVYRVAFSFHKVYTP